MNSSLKHKGFSLTELLLAVGTLAVGMIFIAGVFPVGIHFTTIATERTIAAVAADEAFAKIKLYGVKPDWLLNGPNDICFDFNDVSSVQLNPGEFAYPSTVSTTQKQYYWSALCRRVGLSDVQITVFISRKIGSGTTYRGWARNWPVPVQVSISGILRADELQVEPGRETFINDGYTIVDDKTGDIYRVLERYPDNDTVILLDRPWETGAVWPRLVWVIPPPVGGGRYPCVAIYQKVIGF